MSGYSYWCDFCGEDISFGDCGCDASKQAKKNIADQQIKEKADRHIRLIAAKRFIIECGFKFNQPSFYNSKTDEIVTDPAEIEEAWINSDDQHHNLFDAETVAALLRNKK